jgi:hypothetical protein
MQLAELPHHEAAILGRLIRPDRDDLPPAAVR